jgi:hypothetical protein
MKGCYIVTDAGFSAAKVLAHDGEWAVTCFHGAYAITHLPTGACIGASKQREQKMFDALPDLAKLASFDLQSFCRVGMNDVIAVLDRFGLDVPLYARKTAARFAEMP